MIQTEKGLLFVAMNRIESPFTPETITAALREEGLRITRTRRGIVQALFDSGRPMTLQEIQTAASEAQAQRAFGDIQLRPPEQARSEAAVAKARLL